MAARPEASDCTPKIDRACQPRMFGSASRASCNSAEGVSRKRTPRVRYQANSSAAPPVIVSALKVSGGISRSASFITGQLTPHSSVSSASADNVRAGRCPTADTRRGPPAQPSTASADW